MPLGEHRVTVTRRHLAQVLMDLAEDLLEWNIQARSEFSGLIVEIRIVENGANNRRISAAARQVADDLPEWDRGACH
ncbi:hypothetical protein ACSJLP_09415 [Gordonia rhizosphera NBRC 16068]